MNRTCAAIQLLGVGLTLVSWESAAQVRPAQPTLGARTKQILVVDGFKFRDLNGNGRLDPYEDWRLPVARRIDDLLAQMNVEEKAGMMLIDSMNAGCGGALSTE